MPSPTSTTPTPTTQPGNNGGGGGGGGGGLSLSFTGADTIDLAILGATAVVAGRGLYAFGRRKPQEEDPDAVSDDDISPPV